MSEPDSSPLRITVADSPAALEAHRAAWEQLLEAVPDGRGVFFSIGLLRAMAPIYLLPGRRMHFLLVWAGERLVGAAPTIVDRRPAWRGGVRRLEFWGAVPGSMRFDGDLLVARADEAQACAQALARHLSGPRSPVELIELQYFRDVSPMRAAFAAGLRDARLQPEPMVSHRARLSADWERHAATLGRSMLGKTLNRQRAIERDLGARLVQRERLDEDELDQIERLHSLRQQTLEQRGRSRHVLFGRERDRLAYRAMLEQLAAEGHARHHLLKAGDRVIAFALGLHRGRTFFYQLTAFDPEFSRHEPGRVLVAGMLRAEIDSGRTDLIDMLPGTTKVKQDFCNEHFGHQRLQAAGAPGVMAELRRLLWRLSGWRPGRR